MGTTLLEQVDGLADVVDAARGRDGPGAADLGRGGGGHPGLRVEPEPGPGADRWGRSAPRRGARRGGADRVLRRQHRMVRGDQLRLEPLLRLPRARRGRHRVGGSRPGQRRHVRALRQRAGRRRRVRRSAGRWPFCSNSLHSEWIGVGSFWWTLADEAEPAPAARVRAHGGHDRRAHVGRAGPLRHRAATTCRSTGSRSTGGTRSRSSTSRGPTVRSGDSRSSASSLRSSASRRSAWRAARSTRSRRPSTARWRHPRLAGRRSGRAGRLRRSRRVAAGGPGRPDGRLQPRVGLRRARRAPAQGPAGAGDDGDELRLPGGRRRHVHLPSPRRRTARPTPAARCCDDSATCRPLGSTSCSASPHARCWPKPSPVRTCLPRRSSSSGGRFVARGGG